MLFLRVVGIDPATSWGFHVDVYISVMLCVLPWIWGTYKPNIFINTMKYYTLLLCMISFYRAFLIIGSHIVFISTQLVTVAQQMHCFFKTSYSPMPFTIYYFDFIPWGQIVSHFFSHINNPTRLFEFIDQDIVNLTIKMKIIVQVF